MVLSWKKYHNTITIISNMNWKWEENKVIANIEILCRPFLFLFKHLIVAHIQSISDTALRFTLCFNIADRFVYEKRPYEPPFLTLAPNIFELMEGHGKKKVFQSFIDEYILQKNAMYNVCTYLNIYKYIYIQIYMLLNQKYIYLYI